MKVALKDINPNPWRYINKGYPIDQAKVEKLRSSIKRTGFWDNLVVRKHEGEIQIAYGHHRIEALKKEFPSSHEIGVILRDLDDADMLKIMAAENDAMDIMSPAVVNETVRATLDYLIKSGEIENVPREGDRRGIAPKVAKFLDWSIHRVTDALASIKDFEEDPDLKEEYESLPSQRVAEVYRQQIKKNPLPKSARERVVKAIREQEIGFRGVKDEIIKERLKLAPNGKDRTKIELDDIATQLIKDLDHSSLLLSAIFIKNFQWIDPPLQKRIKGSAMNLVLKLKQLKSNKPKLIGA